MLLGAGPGMNFDFATLSFHVPAMAFGTCADVATATMSPAATAAANRRPFIATPPERRSAPGRISVEARPFVNTTLGTPHTFSCQTSPPVARKGEGGPVKGCRRSGPGDGVELRPPQRLVLPRTSPQASVEPGHELRGRVISHGPQ